MNNGYAFSRSLVDRFAAAGWMRDDTPHSEAQQALAECKYQTLGAETGIGANDHPETWGEAIGDGLATP